MGTSGTLDPRCTRLDLPENMHGDMVNLADGSILTVIDNTVLISEDGGKSWLERGPVCTSPPPGVPRSGMLLRTQNDWVVMVYVDTDAFIWNWNDETRSADANARLDVWAIRSPDGGQTWLDRQRIYEGYCGALTNMVELDRGGIVAPIQVLLRDPDRHAMTSYRSEDDGLTWSHANIIDVGGNGHHDGAMEATIAELTNGSLLMLIRTNFDYFWESFSTDQGRSWRVLQKTGLDASSAPGGCSASPAAGCAWSGTGSSPPTAPLPRVGPASTRRRRQAGSATSCPSPSRTTTPCPGRSRRSSPPATSALPVLPAHVRAQPGRGLGHRRSHEVQPQRSRFRRLKGLPGICGQDFV